MTAETRYHCQGCDAVTLIREIPGWHFFRVETYYGIGAEIDVCASCWETKIIGELLP